jgi:uncharacterized Fe-S radical SAM superfamily protein PflX
MTSLMTCTNPLNLAPVSGYFAAMGACRSAVLSYISGNYFHFLESPILVPSTGPKSTSEKQALTID